jgi:predicted nucleotidyltransferase
MQITTTGEPVTQFATDEMRAERILGRKTDIMTRRSLHKVLRPGIEAAAITVF